MDKIIPRYPDEQEEMERRREVIRRHQGETQRMLDQYENQRKLRLLEEQFKKKPKKRSWLKRLFGIQ